MVGVSVGVFVGVSVGVLVTVLVGVMLGVMVGTAWLVKFVTVTPVPIVTLTLRFVRSRETSRPVGSTVMLVN